MRSYFGVLSPRLGARASVREPLDPRIHLPLIGNVDDDEAELALTVPQALELILDLTDEVSKFCRRADVREALSRTAPGPLIEALGLDR